jgi:hypothetical protein
MMMQAQVKQHRLEHAQWRVDFTRSLLDLHRHSIAVHGTEWNREEAILIERLASAENELQRVTAQQFG